MKNGLHNRWRTLLLSGILVIAALVLVIRWRLLSAPLSPPQFAPTTDKIRFYVKRVRTNPEDISAYVALGKLEESQEFYISALRRFYTARALGAPDREIVIPLGRSLSRLARWDEAETELKKATQLMPDSVEAAANLAGVYYSSGDAGMASRVLNDFLRRKRLRDGSLALSIDDMHRIMLCYAEAKDTRMAAVVALDLLHKDPKDTGAQSIVGHNLLVEQRYREALPYLQAAVALEPNVASLCYNYGTALKHCNQEDEALKQFQKCVLLNPNATDAFIELASLYEMRKNWKLAAVAMSNAALHSKSNYRVLYRAGKINERAGNSAEKLYWYSNAALAAGKYQEALTFANDLSQSRESAWRASGLLNMADAYHGLHKMNKYLDIIKTVANRGTAQDYMRLAGAYEKADLLEKQVEYLKLAVQKEPRLSPQVHNAIAQNLLRRGLRDEAEIELQKAVDEDPGNYEYHTQFGSVLLERRSLGDRLRRAISEFEKAVRIDPTEASGYQNLGIACSAANDLGHAAFYLEHAIDLQPGYGPSYEELGRVYAKMGDKQSSDTMFALYRKYVRYDQILKTLLAKADQNKSDAAAQVELADLLLRSGDYGAALDRYALALQIKPKDSKTQRKYDRVVALLTQSRSSRAPQKQPAQ